MPLTYLPSNGMHAQKNLTSLQIMSSRSEQTPNELSILAHLCSFACRLIIMICTLLFLSNVCTYILLTDGWHVKQNHTLICKTDSDCKKGINLITGRKQTNS